MGKSRWQGRLKSEGGPKPLARVGADPPGPGRRALFLSPPVWGEGAVFWPELQGRVQEMRLLSAVQSP